MTSSGPHWVNIAQGLSAGTEASEARALSELSLRPWDMSSQ